MAHVACNKLISLINWQIQEGHRNTLGDTYLQTKGRPPRAPPLPLNIPSMVYHGALHERHLGDNPLRSRSVGTLINGTQVILNGLRQSMPRTYTWTGSVRTALEILPNPHSHLWYGMHKCINYQETTQCLYFVSVLTTVAFVHTDRRIENTTQLLIDSNCCRLSCIVL